MNRKLTLEIDLYHQVQNYQSLNNLYDVTRTGARVGLSRPLFGNDNLIGGVSGTIEEIGIINVNTNAPTTILNESGYSSLYRAGHIADLRHAQRRGTAEQGPADQFERGVDGQATGISTKWERARPGISRDLPRGMCWNWWPREAWRSRWAARTCRFMTVIIWAARTRCAVLIIAESVRGK